MKIGLEPHPASAAKNYSGHLGELLSRFAPEHEYVFDSKNHDDLDIYHGFRYRLPWSGHRRVPRVVTVYNLNFLRYPQLFPLVDRLFLLRLYRNSCRTADRLIALNGGAREELSQRLGIDDRKIEVVMPLAAQPPVSEPNGVELNAVRAKYGLPGNYLLTVGTIEPRRHHAEIFDAMLEAGSGLSLVICGRRTSYADFLLDHARERGAAMRVDFLYEPDPADLPALFRLARGFVYLPDAEAEASVVPIVEAMRAGLPMVLSDVPLNREAAADAAVYVRPGAQDELRTALEVLGCDEDFRREMIGRGTRRAEIFSEFAVAQRLIDIYSSL